MLKRKGSAKLKSIGKRYVFIKGYEQFGRYCLQRYNGENESAAAAMEKFTGVFSNQASIGQRAMADVLARLEYEHRDIYNLYSRALDGALTEVLKTWSKEVKNPVPLRWLGVRCRSITYLERALTLDPADSIAGVELIDILLSDLDYQTHHMNESVFLGDVEDAVRSLDRIEALIEQVSRRKIGRKQLKDFDRFGALVEAWIRYETSDRSLDFTSWYHREKKKNWFRSAFHYG